MTPSLSSFGPLHIASATCVFEHAAPDPRIRYRLEDVERAFSSYMSAQVASLNVPDSASPEVPRLALRQGSKTILFSQDRIQLTLEFEADDDILKIFAIVRKNAESCLLAMQQLYSAPPALTASLIQVHQTSSEQGEGTSRQIASSLLEYLYKGPKLGTPVSCEIKVGFEVDGMFVNILVANTEMRSGTVKLGTGPKHIRLDELPVVSVGRQITIDINDKPLRGSQTRAGDALRNLRKILDWQQGLLVNDKLSQFLPS